MDGGAIHKYPRTRHVRGSRLQAGDEDLAAVPFAEGLRGRPVVVEEKVDGANSAVSFGPGGELRLQSRGHYLVGGPRERPFDLFKQWAHVHADALRPVLGERYVVYGEWAYAKHTVFYDRLPHYFLEFDVLDRSDGTFLSTPRRRELLAGLPVRSVPVLWEGRPVRLADVTRWVGPSLYKSAGWRENLRASCERHARDAGLAVAETDPSDHAEGLYIKVEEGGVVTDRFKYVRASFLSAVSQSETHWLDRPIVPNGLAAGVDLFAGEP